MADTKTNVKENKMGVMPVNRLLISMSVPMMISMLVQAMYNIVDSMFVAQLNENALTAVSLAFPVQNLMISVAVGTGVGLNALVSRSLGQKRAEYASKAASNGITLYGISYAVFAVLVLCFGKMFFSIQTQDSQILSYGVGYILICGGMSFGLFGQLVLERLLQATGKTIYSMITQTVGAVINIILDPIMIFGLFGFPRMEVKGAALATVTGQICAALLALYFNKKVNKEITIAPFKYRLDKEVVRNIYSVGVPSILMSSIGSVMTFGMNKILLGFTPTATAVFGVYFKLQSFIFMPIFGMNHGLVPIVGYNYGARKPDRIMQTYKYGTMYAVGIMAVGTCLFQFFPGRLLGIFNASETMLEIGIPALRIISIHFMMAGVSIVCTSIFQALGHGFLSLTTSLVRQLIVLLPCAFLLSRVAGLSSIWWSFVAAELVSILMSILFFRNVYRKEILPMKN